jgi:hypothetical protein
MQTEALSMIGRKREAHLQESSHNAIEPLFFPNVKKISDFTPGAAMRWG